MKKRRTANLRYRNLKRFLKEVLLFFLTLLVLAGIYLFFKSNLLRIKKVECFLENDRCPNQVWAGVFDLLKGKSTVSLSKKNLALTLKEKYPYVRDLEIEIHSPRLVVVRLLKRKVLGNFVFSPDFTFFQTAPLKPASEIEKIDRLSEYPNWQIDQEGIVFAQNQPEPQLPFVLIALEGVVEISDGANINEFSDGEVIQLLGLLSEAELRVDYLLVANNEQIIGVVASDWQALLTTEKELNSQVDSLQLILARAKIEGKLPKLVDLRFDKPVISN